MPAIGEKLPYKVTRAFLQYSLEGLNAGDAAQKYVKITRPVSKLFKKTGINFEENGALQPLGAVIQKVRELQRKTLIGIINEVGTDHLERGDLLGGLIAEKAQDYQSGKEDVAQTIFWGAVNSGKAVKSYQEDLTDFRSFPYMGSMIVFGCPTIWPTVYHIIKDHVLSFYFNLPLFLGAAAFVALGGLVFYASMARGKSAFDLNNFILQQNGKQPLTVEYYSWRDFCFMERK